MVPQGDLFCFRFAFVFGLAHREWNVSVLDHMRNALLHRYDEKQQEVQDKNGPENWNIEDFKEGRRKAKENGSLRKQPEFPFWKTTNKRPEFLVARRRKRRIGFGFLGIQRNGRIEARRQEGDEQIQQIDTECIGNNVPALNDKDPDHKDNHADNSECPARSDPRRNRIHEELIPRGYRLRQHSDERRRFVLRLHDG
eukprot:m.54463 g.54463  ORF g.54463 m.54463 type:complete len:197 (+) comp12871_c0_seq1:1931-2521(+)